MKLCATSVILGMLALLTTENLQAALERVYGLESVKIERIFDPNARPEQLLLVSGSLKLVGGYPRGNVWQALTYIPQRAAAPKSDYGIFQAVGNRIYFYSFVSFSTYTGKVTGNGGRIVITKINRVGQSQTEVWYLER